MSSTTKRNSLKHKLPEALEASSSSPAKKTKLSLPEPASNNANDSGLGSSIKKLAKKKKKQVENKAVKRQLIEKEKMSSSKEKEDTQDSGFGSSQTNDVKKSKSPKIAAKRRRPAVKKDIAPVNVAEMNVSEILALGEGIPSASLNSGNVAISDSEDSDFEEVTEELKEPVIPENGVNITLEAPLISFKRKKREPDLEGEIRRQLKRRQKEIQLLMHKVHLLCWIAHIKFLNNILNSDQILTECHKILSAKNYYPPKHADLGYLERIVKVFAKHIIFSENVKEEHTKLELKEALCLQFQKKCAFSKNSFVMMFVVFLRSVGLKVRLVMSLVTVPLKPSAEKGSLGQTGKTIQSKSNLKEMSLKNGKSTNVSSENKDTCKPGGSGLIIKRGKGKACVENTKSDKICESDSEEDIPLIKKSSLTKVVKKEPTSRIKRNLRRNLNAQNNKDVSVKAESSAQSSPEKKNLNLKQNLARNLSPQKISQINSSYQGTESEEEESKHFSREIKPRKMSLKKEALKTTLNKKSQNVSPESSEYKPGTSKVMEENPRTPTKNLSKIMNLKEENSDSDFRTPPKKSGKKIDRRVFSSDDDVPVAKKLGQDVWVEVFLEDEEKWISVDVVRQKVHCVQFLFGRATSPVTYILACNNDSTIKDVTRRYVPHWHSDTRKRRVSEEWWSETMWPYLPPKTPQDKEEDDDIAKQLHDMPLPTSISEYKAHPLYALKRHLLKFEGIYPPEAPTLGFIRGEPVYGRECVVTLRSREIWFKEARVVRLSETPYKIVKSRPKYDKMTGDWKRDLPLELFGVWQTEDYIPPVAVDGKVPRNEYGNVDLFKPCMLPIGTVHLQIPALVRVARKLNIDCAPAVVGFEFHSGGSHPVHDGFVVCEEFKEQLLDAWNKEIDESAKRAEEKRDKRVYGNWRRLIRGLLIRENLKIKYAFGEEEQDVPSASNRAGSGSGSGSAGPAPVNKKKTFRKFGKK